MNYELPKKNLLFCLFFAYAFTWITFSNDEVFWYFYTFTTLFLMSMAFYYAKIEDEVKTLEYLILGIGYGVLTYAILATGYKLLEIIPVFSTSSVDLFISKFGPNAIWHYLLLLFIVAPAEELFWRGFIQQQLKRWLSPFYAVMLSSALFGVSLIFSGFWIGVLGAVLSGLVWGFIYEWKKSMPLIVIAHITMLILLFLILPLG